MVLVCVAALGAGCGALLGDLPTAGTLEAERSDAGDEVKASDGDPTRRCSLAHPPAKPNATDSVSERARVNVLRHLAFPVGSNNEVGYDIDDTCTCDVGSDGVAT